MESMLWFCKFNSIGNLFKTTFYYATFQLFLLSNKAMLKVLQIFCILVGCIKAFSQAPTANLPF